MQTFAQFKTSILAELYPIGVPDNIVTSVDAYFVDALIDIQRWVKCLQQNNTDVISGCNTYFDCGLTVTSAPAGRVQRVSTVANDNWCDRVYYGQTEHGKLIEQSKLLEYTAPPAQPQLVPLPGGVLYAGSESDDTVQGRARRGDYAIYRNRIYILPWIQSNEKVVVDWVGIKRVWGNEDILDYKADLTLAVKHYVRMCYARDFAANDRDLAVYKGEYATSKADLMYECREETRTRESDVTEKYLPTTQQIADSTL